MTSLPSAAALAVLVLVAGIGGVVAADPTETPTATPTAVETTPNATDADPTTMPPEFDGSFEQRLAHRLSQFDLTDGQVRVIVNEAVRLHEDGASRLVIRSSIVMNLYQFGVDAPFLYADGGDDVDSPADRFAAKLGERFDLTDEQVAEIAATIERMHANGASRAEIYRAVYALLVEYGVDEDELDDLRKHVTHAKAHRLHERADALHDRAHRLHHAAVHDGPTDRDGDAVDRHVDRIQARYDLTDEQAVELERLIRDMRADGADREAIVQAVRDRLADWGVDRPTAAGDRATDAPA